MSHSDLLDLKNNRRAAAFVFNFTKLWERDWGGYLQFFKDRGDVELAWRPVFKRSVSSGCLKTTA